MQYVASFCAPKSELPKKVLPLLKCLAEIPDSTEVLLFEEVKFQPELMISEIALEADFNANNIENGDIFIIQERPNLVRTLWQFIPVLIIPLALRQNCFSGCL